jgi:PAS domain S-box-containing protein
MAESRTRTILAVDDTPESLALLVRMLTPLGYRVLAADSGELALAAVATHMPDLILLDVRMQGMDGLEVCRRLKANEHTRRIPVIMVSAFAAVDEWVQGIRLGAADYVTKPFHSEELLARIETHLALRSAVASLEEQRETLRQTHAQLEVEILERMRTEQEMRKTLEQLEHSHQALLGAMAASVESEAARERLATAIEQVAETIVITDVQGLIVYVNPAFSATTGYAREEVLGRSPRILKSGLQDESVYRGLWSTVASGSVWSGRLVNRKKDGTLFTEEVTISPVRDLAGQIVNFVAVKRDITWELSVQEQLLQAQKMDGIGRLAGGVAHDFNNLLSVILNYARFALDGMSKESPLFSDVLEIERAGQRAAALTHQLLAFSRKQVLQPVHLDVNHVLSDMERMLRRIIGEDIEFVLELAPKPCMAKVDASQLQQVIMNLVVNARDAMPTGGRLSVTTHQASFPVEIADSLPSTARKDSYVTIQITDTGVGMDDATQSMIFEPFFTTKGIGKGTGLGLATVYGIVNQSGGHVFVQSAPNQGTTFCIYLPEAERAVHLAQLGTTLAPIKRVESATILLVEDEDALRRVAQRALESAGYRVIAAASGDDAIALGARYADEIQLLLTDVVMPRMNGRTLSEALQQSRPGIGVLYMSGYTDNVIFEHGVLNEQTHLLQKPFTAQQLIKRVREVLNGEAEATPAPMRTGQES